MSQAVVDALNHGTVVGFHGVPRIELCEAIVKHRLPVCANLQHAPGERIAMHGAADDRDDSPVARPTPAHLADRGKFDAQDTDPVQRGA